MATAKEVEPWPFQEGRRRLGGKTRWAHLRQNAEQEGPVKETLRAMLLLHGLNLVDIGNLKVSADMLLEWPGSRDLFASQVWAGIQVCVSCGSSSD